MSKSSQEWVSAAVDGEVDSQAIKQLCSDADSHAQWQRYHLIGDTMRGELPETVDLGLFSKISAAIDLEPTVMAPKSQASDSNILVDAIANEPSKVADISPAKSNVVPFFKQFGQYAIAATVAMVAIVGVQNYDEGNDESPLPVLMTRPLVGNVSPVSLQTGAVQNQQGFTNDKVIEQRRRINAYLQDHMFQQRLNPTVEAEASQQDNRKNQQ